MDGKKTTKIGMSTFFLIIALIIIALMGFFIVKLNNEKQQQKNNIDNLNNQVSNLTSKKQELEGKIDSIAKTIKSNPPSTTTTSTEKNTTVSYIILEIEDKENKNQGEVKYKSKKITDKQIIEEFMKIVESATLYKENSFIADFGDAPQLATVYFTNGEKYMVSAGDQIEDNGEIVNLMNKWQKDDSSDKVLYKVDGKLGEKIEELFSK